MFSASEKKQPKTRQTFKSNDKEQLKNNKILI